MKTLDVIKKMGKDKALAMVSNCAALLISSCNNRDDNINIRGQSAISVDDKIIHFKKQLLISMNSAMKKDIKKDLVTGATTTSLQKAGVTEKAKSEIASIISEFSAQYP